jgi:asparagine synthase (glutamine-hydrolysing)
MCGIAGYLRSEHVPQQRELLRPMCDQLIHRGPDGYGEFFDPDIALGHRRLSVIDLEGGAQPLGNEDESIQAIFNGEIYNHKELRRQLAGKGHCLRTASDTEVLVHLYEEHGENMPELLNGMFAFAIWDGPRKKLFLARDRFGEKPLYFSTCLPSLRVCFASELKALMLLPGVDRSIRPAAVSEFLSSGYIADPATIYQQMQRLSPGTCMTVDWENICIRRYWSPSFRVTPGLNFSASTEEVSEIAAEAVRSRLMSDVPLGAFLSGGLDSSAVVASMSESAREPVRTFSIGFDSPEFDERAYARLVAERHRTTHREFVVAEGLTAMVDLLVEKYDEPFGDSSAIPTLCLAQLAREDVTVALSGDGADEVFGGYARYGHVIDSSLRELIPARFRRLNPAVEWCFDSLPQLFASPPAMREFNRSVVDRYFCWISTTDEDGLNSLLSPDLLAKMEGYTPKSALADRFARHRELPLLQQMQAVDMETYLPGDILVKMDRATMAFSLESRAPWLDHRLADYAGALPQGFKWKRGIGKRILRRAFESRLPEATLSRPKMGFGPPLAAWLRTSLKGMFEEYVFQPEMSQYLNLAKVQQLWQEHQSGENDYRIWILWNILILSRWHARYRHGLVEAHFVKDMALTLLQARP